MCEASYRFVDSKCTPCHSFTLPLPQYLCRWLIATGSDVGVVSQDGTSVFHKSLKSMPLDFVKDLIRKVPREHLSLRTDRGVSPMGCLSMSSRAQPDAIPIMKW